MIRTVLITGLTGFVGQNLQRYIQSGFPEWKIIGIGRKVPDRELAGLEGLDVRHLVWDQLNEVIDEVDAVIHLAGKAHDVKNTSKEKEYFDVNFGLTKKIFDFFLASKARKFIYLSSVKAVADVVSDVLTEEVEPVPATVYGKSKLKAEQYITNTNLPKEKDVYILRPCMIHGPGNKGNLNLLFSMIKKGLPYPLGAFENKRSFLSVNNLSFVIEQILTREIANGVYNVADNDPLSTSQLISLMGTVLQKKFMIWNIPPSLIRQMAKAGDVLRLPLNTERLKKMTENYEVSNHKIKNVLGQDFPVASEEGLTKTFQSFI